eukprot:TRINITY_DN19718_c0_g1::TRINITY_DN19718_c0_g1_i1::g.3290::m.3290 TRINITY_DN19718_c0_g1::TRINITY_DN19718_c0_g1_i1::g.3290  ORF type:complete len:473 (+),score=111.48,sp/P15729/GLCP_SYNY3/29.62/9e-52,Sugar_tr/PF00083.19/4.5e-83,MFS_1/PF07690.11/4.9e-17,MFS_1/PF07690.11/2.6e-07,TRI12/PF06609.8/0.36,TRI12/PF06609.8/0.00068,MFS_2/PF13347.1/0.011,MFS_2/PF13347.1/0.00084,MFS_2/PF13347.1/1.3e+02,Fanconi_A/PF03511.9/1.5e+04,Fanconi_A/PF03511.9/0.32 TRINITY_DN19718_c0_g1_i1:62-1420(+)
MALHASVVSLFGGFIFGYNSGIISGLSGPLVECVFFPDASEDTQSVYQGLLTACILVGAAFGAFASVDYANHVGRKRSMMLTGAWCALTASLLAIFTDFWAQIAIRTLLGYSVGAAAAVIPLYVSEVCDISVRGRVGCVLQIAICSSILFAQVTNYLFNLNEESCEDMDDKDDFLFNEQRWRWRLQYGLGAIPGALLFLYSFVIPETPVYLEMAREAESHGKSVAELAKHQGRGSSMLYSAQGTKWLFLGAGLAATQQLTGINAIIFFSPSIFEDAGQEDNALLLTLLVVGLWNFLSVFVTPVFVDRFGRKPLFMGALVLMLLGCTIMGIAFAAIDAENRLALAVPAIMLFILGFEVGPGPLFFILASEMFPMEIREASMSWTSGCVWVFNLLVSFLFPIAVDLVGATATFFFFSLMCLLSLVFMQRHVKETKDNVIGKQGEDQYHGLLDHA